MQKLYSLDDCLFRAFAGTNVYDPQDRSIMWAILEGIARIDALNFIWRKVDARKKHECLRGCTIPEGSKYFHYTMGAWTWNDELKICASCMAMILYFRDVERLPHHIYTHWDIETKEPVRIPKD